MSCQTPKCEKRKTDNENRSWFAAAVAGCAVLSTLVCLSTVAQVTRNMIPGSCKTELDCGLLGECVSGQCVCDPGFTSPNCVQFDLLPSKQASIEGFDDSNYPTWCTRVIYADGEWHMISSYIKNKCALYDYATNGAFLRATAPHPLGPFVFKEEVVPPFHHGAHVERGLDGSYLIFGDGRVMPQSTVRTNCGPGGPGRSKTNRNLVEHGASQEATHSGRDLQRTNLYPRGNSPNDVHMVYIAPKITGPWTRHEIPELQTNIKQFSRWNCNKTNLAPLILKNGTVLMGYRSKSCQDMQWQIDNVCGSSCQKIGIAVSHHGVRGPYVLRESPIRELDGNEDPFMWKNDRGYFMAFHGKVVCGSSQAAINTCGTLGYSRDSFTWYQSPFPLYDGRVNFHPSTGKTFETLALRHRPKILFDNEGVPLVLYNGGQRNGQNYVRSFAFAFNVPQMRDFKQPPECPPKPYVNICTTHERRGITYDRTEPGCRMMGSENCIWCESKQRCMPGTDDRICTAASLDTFYAHC